VERIGWTALTESKFSFSFCSIFKWELSVYLFLLLFSSAIDSCLDPHR
jgi:hypothetical protein